jgi:amino acid adenylation domain-containing protein
MTYFQTSESDCRGVDRFEAAEAYWRAKLSGELPEIRLRPDLAALNQYAAAQYRRPLEAETVEKLLGMSRHNDLLLYIEMLAAFKILLFRYSGEEDVWLASPVYKPNNRKYNRCVVLRDRLHRQMRFVELLSQVKQTVMDGYMNEFVPLARLKDCLAVRPGLSFTRHILSLTAIHDAREVEEIIASGENELAVAVDRKGAEMAVTVVYNSKLFRSPTIRCLVDGYVHILDQVLAHPPVRLGEIEWLTPAQKDRLLVQFNATERAYPVGCTVHEWFEQQAAAREAEVAVLSTIESKNIYDQLKSEQINIELSYGELNERASQLARELRLKGVRPDTLVGLLVRHPLELAVGLMGILKSGAAYLPVDADYPERLLAYMIKDSGLQVLVTEEAVCAGLPGGLMPLALVALDSGELADHDTGNPDRVNEDSHLAYGIYTSGTTGFPRGVLIEHRGLVNYARWRLEAYHYTAQDVTLQPLSYCFDGFGSNFYSALLSGGSLVIIPQAKKLDFDYMRAVIRQNRVTNMSLVPGIYRLILEGAEKGDLDSLRFVVLAGEESSGRLIEMSRQQAPQARLANEYGPTETTVTAANWQEMDHTSTAIIGRPIANTRIYIMDSCGHPLPPRFPGEIGIAGAGVARGYLNNPESTSDKFITATAAKGREGTRSFPHQPLTPKSQILYRTGDQGRWLEGGKIEFVRRLDHQVKIRGYRVELAQVENWLLQCAGVKAVVVVARQDETGGGYLCAYVVPADIETAPLRAFLAQQLPEYMLPAYFIPLEQIPLTANGKVDRRALPPPGTGGPARRSTAPRDRVEKGLAQIWSEVLHNDRQDIDDNFFDLGGHSLRVTMLVTRIKKVFDVEVQMADVFATPTIRGLAELVRRGAKGRYEAVETIEPVEKRDYYPLSSSQKRLYILQQMVKDNIAYNIPGLYRLEETLNRPRLAAVFKKLAARHESFRTSFTMAAGEPVQRIGEGVALKIESYRCSSPGEMMRDFIRPFDLGRAPLLRVGFIEGAQGQDILMIDMHHIVTDAFSRDILVKECMSLYDGTDLPPLRVTYKDYACWQGGQQSVEAKKDQERYWLERFGGEIPLLELPVDFPRPEVQDFSGRRVAFSLGGEESEYLKTLTKMPGGDTSLFMVMLGVFVVLLSKLSGNRDIVVGTAVAGRRQVDLEQVIGMFVNTLALRSHVDPRAPFTTFLYTLKRNTLEAFENQEYPFEDLVEKLDIPRDAGRNPLFDVMFTLQAPGNGGDSRDIRPQPFAFDIAKFDLSYDGFEGNGQLHFYVEYSSRLFKEETVLRFNEAFRQLASSLRENQEAPIGALEIITPAEKRRVLFDFNHTLTDYPRDRTIPELFAQQAAAAADRIALVAPGHEGCLSYRQTDRRADSLAAVLMGRGVKPNTIVAMQTERSAEMVIAILGILKAGGAYLPIEVDCPEERVQYMLSDSGARVVLSDRFLSGVFGKPPQPGPPARRPRPAGVSPTDLAYVIYTSGTTGRPKGTLTAHTNVVRVVRATNYIDILKSDRLLQLSNYAFDGSVFDIYGALLNGAALVMLKKEEVLALDRLARLIKRSAVSLFFITTSLFNTLVDFEIGCLSWVRKVLFGGERVSVEHVNKALGTLGRGRLVHVYGPTEATVYATYYFIDRPGEGNSAVPIGKPIANTTVYILDPDGKPLPIGLGGEIYIGGDGPARGYLNRPELTAEKFINLAAKGREGTRSFPHQPLNPKSQILYRTGDLCRFLPDGNIDFLGRIDHQVKIRGFRIEPAEIEALLLRHPAVREAVVMVREDLAAERYLCAYVVSSAPETLPDYLSRKLPAYMVPAQVVQLEKMPLTPNGKIDRRKLPRPDTRQPSAAVSAPADRLERELAAIWAEVLGRERHTIGTGRSFFELGGHSLKATILVARIHRAFDVHLQIADIFAAPTIREMAGLIRAAAKDLFEGIRPVEQRDYYELSPAQKRLYILQQMRPQAAAYNIPLTFPLEKEADQLRIETTFKKLLARHESLRTSFTMIDGGPVQRVHRQVGFQIECYDLPPHPAPAGIMQDFVRPFDLSRPPLLRARLVAMPGERQVLMIDVHHIVTDGSSQGILVREFLTLYRGEELPPQALSYKDYALWQNRLAAAGAGQVQRDYWLEVFSGDIPVLNLPTDYPRPARQSFAGKLLEFELTGEETAALKALALDLGGTLFMVLLAAFNVWLARLSGQEDIVVGVPVAGRRHADLSAIIGMFVNTLALRSQPRPERTFTDFFREVRHRTLGGFENQDYPFEDLVESLQVNRDAARNPLFDVMLVLQNLGGEEAAPQDEYQNPYDEGIQVSKFDLTFNGFERAGQLFFKITYCTALFKEESIARWIGYFKRVVGAILTAPELEIGEIEILPEAERQRILHQFNDTAAPFPANRTILQFFARQLAAGPDTVAVAASRDLCPGRTFVSRRELNERSGRLAVYLRGRGAAAGDIVALRLAPSAERIMAMLGVLQAGAAYLPISPQYPEERVRFLLSDSNAGIMIDDSVDEILENRGQAPERPRQSPAPDLLRHPAYVIYTSGSSGRPKGVLVEHHSVVNVVCWFIGEHRLDENARVLQLTDYTFDASVNQVFGSLCSGAQLCVPPRELIGSAEAFRRCLDRQRITLVNFVPTVLRDLLIPGPPLASLQTVVVGGERLDDVTRDRLAEKGYRVVNQYGPTETTIDALAADCSRGEITLGKPIANMCCYILDRNRRPAPIGVAGEICIGGRGVARGYLNNPDLTAERFVNAAAKLREGTPSFQNTQSLKDPIIPLFQHSIIPEFKRSGRLYRTGDLGRFRPEGTVEFMGRLDHQVKIRGNRIELAEIENLLLRHEGIDKALAVVGEAAGGEPFLCAYVVPLAAPASPPDRAALTDGCKDYLSRQLPDYMVPSRLVVLEKMPLTVTGKIDRRALPAPEVEADGTTAAPANRIEGQLLDICRRLLKRDNIGLGDDFFALGGSSLTAIQLVGEIYRAFQAGVSTVQIFQNPRIGEIANRVIQSRFMEAEDEPLAVFNPSAPAQIFCFPPALSFGIAYYQLSLLMPDYTFYAFNYIEAQDRIERYVRAVVEARSRGCRGPLILLGYSAGGQLCLKVAAALASRGSPVSDIILIDSYRQERRLAEPEMERYLDTFGRELADSLAKLGLGFMKAKVIDRCRQYARYLNGLVELEPVAARLHLILAEDSEESLDSAGWRDLTDREVRLYRGVGRHRDMMQMGCIEENAALLQKILTGLEPS